MTGPLIAIDTSEIREGKLDELRHLTRTTIVAETERPATAVATLPGIHGFHSEDGRVRFDVDAEHLDATVRSLSELGVRSLQSHPPTLEQLFPRFYGVEEAERAEGPAAP